MKISCIIPTCNRNNFLIEAINSVLKQTLLPDEIIIVNNGEKAVMLPDEMAGKVKIYNIIPYAGASQARNFGASLANGDFLAFLDDDDLWEENYLKNAMSAINEGFECIVSRLDKIVNNQVKRFKNAFGKLDLNNILIQNPGITGSNIVISKNIFFNVRGFDPLLPPSEDKALILELLRIGGKIKVLPDNQAIIRMHYKERLSDAEKMIEGVSQFIRKYRKLMNKKQYLFNFYKIYKYKYQSGSKIAGVKYFFIKIIYNFFKLLNKIWNRRK